VHIPVDLRLNFVGQLQGFATEEPNQTWSWVASNFTAKMNRVAFKFKHLVFQWFCKFGHIWQMF
jgi:hypothetical protein